MKPGNLVCVTSLGQERLYSSDIQDKWDDFIIKHGDIYLVLGQPVKCSDYYGLFTEWSLEVLFVEKKRKVCYSPKSGECLTDYLQVIGTQSRR
jgi:hypothetical protein